MKYNLEKWAKNAQSLGSRISRKGDEAVNAVQMINADTDMKIFIDENRSYA